MNKLTSLARFLEVEKDSIEVSNYDDNLFIVDGKEYLVYTDKQADKAAKEYILETAWAFNTWFIMDNLNARFSKVNSDTMEEIIKDCQSRCESGNDAILEFIKKGDFVSDAIRYDGRGHFLSSYDGNEYEQDCYYIYRAN